MILVTGGTGFIGSALVRQLASSGYPVRLLIHPSKYSPKIPKKIPLEVALAGFNDERGIRAALKDVDYIYHLAGAEQLGSRADLLRVDIEGTRILAKMAAEMHIERFVYLSHLGANRASAFPVLKAKGIAESVIKNESLNFTIIRSAIVFGENDHFTSNLRSLINIAPGFLFVPGKGDSLLQPIWINDLITCLTWTIDLQDTNNQILEIGGPEYLSIKDVMLTIMKITGKKREILEMNPVYMHLLTEFLENFSKKFPTSVFWLDYLSENRICSLDSLTNHFKIKPARFIQHLDHLQHKGKKLHDRG